jgi:hypothetical protein
MAQNLAAKYSPKVAERFYAKNLTELAVNNDYDWDGVTTVNVYSVNTTPLGTYTRSGAGNRYQAAPTDAGTTVQALTLSRDRSASVIIDKRNNAESQNVLDAGKWLARQIREVIIPEIDTYRLAALGTASTTNGNSALITPGATTSANAYQNFLTLNASLTDNLVDTTGRVAFMTQAYYNLLKQSNFILASEDAMGGRHNGVLGSVDGCKVVVVPSTYMPTSTDLIITHPSAMVSPMVLTDYTTHDNPPGVSGQQIDMRVVYDAFVLTAKIKAVAAHKTA